MLTKHFFILAGVGCLTIAAINGCHSETNGIPLVTEVKVSSPQVASTKPSKADMDAMLRKYPTAAYAAARARVDGLEKEAKAAMAAGHFAEAYSAFQSEKATWETLGTKQSPYRPEELECLFQMGKYSEVVKLTSGKNAPDAETAAVIGVSLLREGHFTEAQKLFSADRMILRYMADGNYKSFVPEPTTVKNLECDLYLARGIERKIHADFPGALIEFRRADVLLPYQPLISYYLGDALWHLGRTKEASAYGEVAKKLGGTIPNRVDRFSSPIRSTHGQMTGPDLP